MHASVSMMRVLIVDNERKIRKTLSVCLQGLGCQVTEAGTSASALEVIADSPQDLAFVDLRLGQENGLDLLPKLFAERPGLDVVMITAYAELDTAVEAMRRGAKDYVAKPFTPAQIRCVVETLRARREPSLGGDATVEAVEREHILRVIARTRTREEAARILGLDVSTLWRKRRRYGSGS